jgi:hypothetical protein
MVHNKKIDDWNFTGFLNYVKSNMQQNKFTPLGVAYSNKEGYLIPLLFSNDKEKSLFFEAVKILFLAKNIDHYILAFEAWVSPQNESNSENRVEPRLDPNRKDALTVVSVNSKRKRMTTFEIIKKENNEIILKDYVNVVDDGTSKGYDMHGRMFDLLPKPGYNFNLSDGELINLLSMLNISIVSSDFLKEDV